MTDLSAINRKLRFLVSNPLSALGAFKATSQNQTRRLSYPFDESELSKVFFEIFGSQSSEAKNLYQRHYRCITQKYHMKIVPIHLLI